MIISATKNSWLQLLLLLSFPFSSLAQNLLPNPSFEDINTCHKYHEECCPSAWRSTTPKLIKYHRHDQHFDPGLAQDGNKYLSLLLYDKARKFDRKFLQGQLLCPLEKGQLYEFSIYIKTEQLRIRQLEVVFRDSVFFEKNNTALMGLQADISLPLPANFQASQWTKLKANYRATGQEKFILIGNFSPDEASDIQPIDEKAFRKASRRYRPKMRLLCMVDQLSLQVVEGAAPNCDLEARRAAIYRDSFRHISPPPAPLPTAIKIDSIPPSPPPPPSIADIKAGKVIVLKNVNFQSGTALLIDASFQELQNIRNLLIQNPNLGFVIKGHTDDVGQASDNWQLSRERAKTVYDYLARNGVDKRRMRYEGFGETRPIASNATAAGRLLNRRVEIEID